jgi:hypothetical protein
MQLFDWIILIVTLLLIVVYGAWKQKEVKTLKILYSGNNENSVVCR